MNHEGSNDAYNMTSESPKFENYKGQQKDDNKVCIIDNENNPKLPTSSTSVPIKETVFNLESAPQPTTSFPDCGCRRSNFALSHTTSSHSYFNPQTGTSIVHVTSPNRAVNQTFRENSIYIERQWEMLKDKMMQSNKIDSKHFKRNSDNFDDQKYDLDFTYIDESITNEAECYDNKKLGFNRSTPNIQTESHVNNSFNFKPPLTAIGLTNSTSLEGFQPTSSHNETKYTKLNQALPSTNNTVYTTMAEYKKSLNGGQGLLGACTKPITSFKNTLSYSTTGIVSSTSSPVSSASFFSATTGTNRTATEKPLFIRSFKEEFLSNTGMMAQQALSSLTAHTSNTETNKDIPKSNNSSISDMPILVGPKFANLSLNDPKKVTQAVESPSSEEDKSVKHISHTQDLSGWSSNESPFTSSLSASVHSTSNFSVSTSSENKNATFQQDNNILETPDIENVVTTTTTSLSSKTTDSSSKSSKYQEMLSRKTLKSKHKKEKVVTSNDVPNYKGNATLDDIINFINNETKAASSNNAVSKIPKKSKKKSMKEFSNSNVSSVVSTSNKEQLDASLLESSPVFTTTIITPSNLSTGFNVIETKCHSIDHLSSIEQNPIKIAPWQQTITNDQTLLMSSKNCERPTLESMFSLDAHTNKTNDDFELDNKKEDKMMKPSVRKLKKTSSLDCDKNSFEEDMDDDEMFHSSKSGLMSEDHTSDDNLRCETFSVVLKKKKRIKQKQVYESFNPNNRKAEHRVHGYKNKTLDFTHQHEPKYDSTNIETNTVTTVSTISSKLQTHNATTKINQTEKLTPNMEGLSGSRVHQKSMEYGVVHANKTSTIQGTPVSTVNVMSSSMHSKIISTSTSSSYKDTKYPTTNKFTKITTSNNTTATTSNPLITMPSNTTSALSNTKTSIATSTLLNTLLSPNKTTSSNTATLLNTTPTSTTHKAPTSQYNTIVQHTMTEPTNHFSMCKSSSIPDKVSTYMNVFLDTRLLKKSQLTSSLDIQFGFDDDTCKQNANKSLLDCEKTKVCDNKVIPSFYDNIDDIQFIDSTDLTDGHNVLGKVNGYDRQCVQFINIHNTMKADVQLPTHISRDVRIPKSTCTSNSVTSSNVITSTMSHTTNTQNDVQRFNLILTSSDADTSKKIYNAHNSDITSSVVVSNLNFSSQDFRTNATYSTVNNCLDDGKMNTTVITNNDVPKPSPLIVNNNTQFQTNFCLPIGIVNPIMVTSNDLMISCSVSTSHDNQSKPHIESHQQHTQQQDNTLGNESNIHDALKINAHKSNVADTSLIHPKHHQQQYKITTAKYQNSNDYYNTRRSSNRMLDCSTKKTTNDIYCMSDAKLNFSKPPSSFDLRLTQMYLNSAFENVFGGKDLVIYNSEELNSTHE